MNFKPCPHYEVPYSELAMHMKIAGKEVIAYAVYGNWNRCCAITLAGEADRTPYTGPVSELLPMELRHES